MSLPVVVIFGRNGTVLKSKDLSITTETTEFQCHSFSDDSGLTNILRNLRPHVIVTFGSEQQYTNLLAAPFSVRKRWLNFEDGKDLDLVGEAVMYCLIDNVFHRRSSTPLISIFTPTYRSLEKIRRPFESLMRQNYKEWEWILFDDSNDDNKTFNDLMDLSKKDHRISVYKSHRHSGRIGEVKRQACGLCNGDILLELDHDDELTLGSLDSIVTAFGRYPEAGFLYSDWAEVFENGVNATYGKGWAFGYGSTREETYLDKKYIVNQAPHINSVTIRHIVSAPNHVRAWRKDFYWQIGGHNADLSVADDYELCVRTFLNTDMILLKRFNYIQYYNSSGNTQRIRNKDIQRFTRLIQYKYDKLIHERLISYGIEDLLWDNKINRIDWNRDKPFSTIHCGPIVEQEDR